MLQNFVSYYLFNFYYVCSYLFKANLGAKKEIMIGYIDSTLMFLIQFGYRIAFHYLKKKLLTTFIDEKRKSPWGTCFYYRKTSLRSFCYIY